MTTFNLYSLIYACLEILNLIGLYHVEAIDGYAVGSNTWYSVFTACSGIILTVTNSIFGGNPTVSGPPIEP